ncbi:hypothetical protein KIN20_004530 [Parelaphostrongylus tenuis]|uniref:Uncharacterized protein n=1 Tax=Parelaphostrongylus tenuis TaxID=148309 RepID=A0AAD5MJX6_PARTN|nr:hypothetical protein KIN20_004530 [Parelaphostrongylus tenuis]
MQQTIPNRTLPRRSKTSLKLNGVEVRCISPTVPIALHPTWAFPNPMQHFLKSRRFDLYDEVEEISKKKMSAESVNDDTKEMITATTSKPQTRKPSRELTTTKQAHGEDIKRNK